MIPTLGRIVIYRTQDGVRDHTAIITRVIEGSTNVFLTAFPPGKAPYAVVSSVPEHTGDEAPRSRTWRWPKRTEA